ncbi:MAG: hypothetical protein U5K43_09675 [Halofilum sp. (in: g-proteobacteria)]|nr:hypothetical protein [Halofilum sp. (in: g-proteobacteria)]
MVLVVRREKRRPAPLRPPRHGQLPHRRPRAPTPTTVCCRPIPSSARTCTTCSCS